MTGAALAVEQQVKSLCAAGRHDDALGALLRGFGEELLGFVSGQLRDEDLAADAFAVACEDLWRGLPTFRFEASVRTWAYRVVRHACARVARDPRRRRERNVPLSQASLVGQLEHELRAATTRWQRTAEKDKLRALRDALSADDQALLTLRLDRGLSWLEIADVLREHDDETDDADVGARKRRAAGLRKRFERLKERLRAAAIDAGLVPEGS